MAEAAAAPLERETRRSARRGAPLHIYMCSGALSVSSSDRSSLWFKPFMAEPGAARPHLGAGPI
eukprot:3205275-Pyramimonas_sp.AAC.1